MSWHYVTPARCWRSHLRDSCYMLSRVMCLYSENECFVYYDNGITWHHPPHQRGRSVNGWRDTRFTSSIPRASHYNIHFHFIILTQPIKQKRICLLLWPFSTLKRIPLMVFDSPYRNDVLNISPACPSNPKLIVWKNKNGEIYRKISIRLNYIMCSDDFITNKLNYIELFPFNIIIVSPQLYECLYLK